MRRKGVSYAKYGYLFCLPFVLAFIIFTLYPLIYTAVIGFTDLQKFNTDLNLLDKPLDNFKFILNNQSFRKSLNNTVVIWLMNFLPQILMALLLAAWFTNNRRKIKGQGAFKVLFYMPNIITAGTIAILFNRMFGYPIGIINDLFEMLGWIDEPIELLRNKWTARGAIAFIQFWTWYGNTMIVFIAGILGINPELYEAAEIDGATGRQSFFYVTLPNLRTIMLFTLVTSLVGGLQMYDIPALFNAGNPDNTTRTVTMFIRALAFENLRYNVAAAASILVFIVIAALSGIIFFVMRDKAAIQQKKIERKYHKDLRRADKEARRAA